MRRKVWIGGGLVALLASVLAVLFLVDFDSPRLGKALLAQVSAQTGLHVEADGFRLNLLRGVRLDGAAGGEGGQPRLSRWSREPRAGARLSLVFKAASRSDRRSFSWWRR
jgi:hypothetical protein